MEITCVTFDVDDPGRVAEFWNAALEWGGVALHPDGTGAICGPATGRSYLEFTRDVEGNEFCLSGGVLPL